MFRHPASSLEDGWHWQQCFYCISTLSNLNLLFWHCHLHQVQAANCYRNSRLAVDEDDLKWVAKTILLLSKQFRKTFRSKTPSCKKLKHPLEMQNDIILIYI